MIAGRPSHVSPRAFALALADFICIASAAAIACHGRLVLTTLYDEPHEIALLLPLGALLLGVCYVCGLYDNRTLVRTETALFPSAMGAATAAGMTLALDEVRSVWPVAVVFAGLLFAGLVCVRWLHARMLRAGLLCSRTVVVGSQAEADAICRTLDRFYHPDFDIVGVVRPDRRERLADAGTGEVPVLGTLSAIRDLVSRYGVQRVIVAGGAEADPEVSRELRLLRHAGIGVIDELSLHELVAKEIPLEHVDESWLFRASMYTSRFHIKGTKRLVDVVVTLLAAIPAALLFAGAALAIRLTDKGPILFRQERLGLHGRHFMLLKLRTMRVDAEKHTGPVWSTDNDPRITRIGRLLRKFRLDELPQLWNVLRGDMSLVGPRPERPELADRISQTVPLFKERLTVRPGITGWAQVMAPYAASIEDSGKKLQYDLYYTKHLSLLLDLRVVVKTLKTMVLGREREQGGMVAGRLVQSQLRGEAGADDVRNSL